MNFRSMWNGLSRSCLPALCLPGMVALLSFGITFAATPAAEIRVLNADAHFPEGPVWYQDKLYYAEYDRNVITVWDGKKNTEFSADKGCGQSAVVPRGKGFVTTCYDNGTLGRIAADGKVLAPYKVDKDGNAFVGPNDLAQDGHGGIYFTASGTLGPVIDGKVFFLSEEGVISMVAANLHNPNGLAVSKDGKLLYVVETEDNRLLRFTIEANASLTNRRVFLNLNEMTRRVTHIWPDGIKISSKGEIYIGQSPRDLKAPLTGKIFVVDAQAKWLRTISLPSPKVPNMAFSPDEKTLYVTAVDQIDQSPYAGKVYAVPNE